jgi:hypothetical protein
MQICDTINVCLTFEEKNTKKKQRLIYLCKANLFQVPYVIITNVIEIKSAAYTCWETTSGQDSIAVSRPFIDYLVGVPTAKTNKQIKDKSTDTNSDQIG